MLIGDDLARYDNHPPLYFWLLHVWIALFGLNLHSGVLLNIGIALVTGSTNAGANFKLDPLSEHYNAAKFGVRGFTDALRMELDIEGCGVSATTIHPGGIKTNIARNARVDPALAEASGDLDAGDAFDKLALTTPEKAARQILKAVERNRRRALIGPDAKVFDLVSRLPAGLYQRLLVQGARRRAR